MTRSEYERASSTFDEMYGALQEAADSRDYDLAIERGIAARDFARSKFGASSLEEAMASEVLGVMLAGSGNYGLAVAELESARQTHLVDLEEGAAAGWTREAIEFTEHMYSNVTESLINALFLMGRPSDAVGVSSERASYFSNKYGSGEDARSKSDGWHLDVLIRARRYKEAEEFGRALINSLETQGKTYSGAWIAASNAMATIKGDTGYYQDSAAILRDVIANYPTDDLEFSNYAPREIFEKQLGIMLVKGGKDIEEGKRRCELAASVLLEKFGPLDTATIGAINCMAAADVGLGNFAEAEKLLIGLVRQLQPLGKSSDQYLLSICSLANVYLLTGHLEQSADLLRSTNTEIAAFESTNGTKIETRGKLGIIQSLAAVDGLRGDITSEKVLLRQAVTLAEQLDESLTKLIALRSLASAELKSGNIEVSESLLLQYRTEAKALIVVKPELAQNNPQMVMDLLFEFYRHANSSGAKGVEFRREIIKALYTEQELFGTNAPDSRSENVSSFLLMLATSYLEEERDLPFATMFLKESLAQSAGYRVKQLANGPIALNFHRGTQERSQRLLQAVLIEQGRFSEAEIIGRLSKQYSTSLKLGTQARESGTRIPFTELEEEWLNLWIPQRESNKEFSESPLAEFDPIFDQQRIDRERDRFTYGLARTMFWNGPATAKWKSLIGPSQSYLDKLLERPLRTVNRQESLSLFSAWEDHAREVFEKEPQNWAMSSAGKTALELDPGVAMVQIAHGEQSLHFFVTTATYGLQYAEVEVELEVLFDLLGRARSQLVVFGQSRTVRPKANDRAQASKEDLQRTLLELHRLVMPPEVERMLTESQTITLIISVDGPLQHVPFGALYDGDQYLIEKYNLARYTWGDLNYERPLSLSRGEGFGMSAASNGFDALPGVAGELEAVFGSDMVPGSLLGRVRMNSDFNRDTLQNALSNHPPVLHIASHFNMDMLDSGNSFLLLGDGSRITLKELSASPHFSFEGVELLVLSACSTSNSTFGLGVEAEGLGAVAQLRGAQAVMATLWNVSDLSTAMLMADFYTGLANENETKASALRDAQLRLIDRDRSRAAEGAPDYSHPYYWAPFILMGNWK